jgi:hypothetical protein
VTDNRYLYGKYRNIFNSQVEMKALIGRVKTCLKLGLRKVMIGHSWMIINLMQSADQPLIEAIARLTPESQCN